MKLDLKKFITQVHGGERLFNVLLLLFIILWFGGLAYVIFLPVDVQVKRTTQTVRSIDETTYKPVAEYIDSVKKFQLPDFLTTYNNSEPFSEYTHE